MSDLLRRVKKIEEHPAIKQESRQRKVVFINADETRDEAFIRQGVNPKDPGVDLIIVHFVKSPNANRKDTDKVFTVDLGLTHEAQDRISQGD